MQFPTEHTVLYDSFDGRGFSDSPRALYEEFVERDLDLTHLWIARNPAAFPSDVQHVVFGSDEHKQALKQAKFLIGNTYTPAFAGKPTGALYLQTWHGTPLKRLHYDRKDLTADQIANMDPEPQSWDVLLTPNAFSTGVLPGAFRYDGEVWETGYPRNDILSRDTDEAVRKRVRAQLGLPDDKKVVLYAPTFRDDQPAEAGAPHGHKLELDLDAFHRELGEDHVLLLRLHYFVAARLGDVPPPAINVSEYPDIRDLYLACDVLITDYSSSMFDFAVTRKPMIFFTYDLDHYRNDVRGLYFDFEPAAPGPLVEKSDEVFDALRDLEQVSNQYKAKYEAFRERFCHTEDGHVSERIVNKLLAR